VVENLPSLLKALSLIPSTTKINVNRKIESIGSWAAVFKTRGKRRPKKNILTKS
jgi:hypothetical protein